MKVSTLLEEVGFRFERLLLNFPIELEDELNELASDILSFDDFIDKALKQRLIPEPFGAWEYSARPILKVLPKLKVMYPNLSICCFRLFEHEHRSVNAASELAKLTLRTTLRRFVDVREWRESLNHSLEINKEIKQAEVEAIKAMVGRSSVCVSDMNGSYFGENLRSSKIFVKVHYIERSYHFTPLVILKRLMSKRFVTNREIEWLVRSHLEYIRKYVYIFDNRDRAYYEWVYDKIPWMRGKIEKKEIQILDNIINRS
jgi:hypothetical protein